MNLQLAYMAIKEIEANPEIWVRDSWRRGKACDIAGHVALLDGWQWADPHDDSNLDMYKDYGGIWVHVAEAARRSLGVGVVDMLRLCSGSNTLDDIKRLVEKWS